MPIMRSANTPQAANNSGRSVWRATEKSVNEKRRSSEAKRKAFFFLAFRPSVVASERVCVFLCYFICTRKAK